MDASKPSKPCINIHIINIIEHPASRSQRYLVPSDTLGREFDPGKRDFLTENKKTKKTK